MEGIKKHYDFAVIATDVVIMTIIEGELKILLIKMKKAPFENAWAIPGGLVDSEESVFLAAKRHLSQKAGLKDIFLEQLYTFGDVSRDPFGRVVSVAYLALAPANKVKPETTGEYDGIEWHPVYDLPELAYDHKEMVDMAVKRLQSKLEYTNIVYNLLEPEFTLTDMQVAYEVILGRGLDKRNFRKKILSLNIVKKIGKNELGKQNRPAELYSFVDKELKEVEIL